MTPPREIQLGPGPSGASSDSEQPSSSIVTDEKPQTPSGPHGDTPISYLYLTFDTALPAPPAALRDAAARDRSKAPPCPDLRPYTSPLEWSPARKNVLLGLSCIATFLTAYTAGCYSPPAVIMAADLDTSRLVVLVGITTFCLGFAFAPMALAPISEIWGRFPVFVAAGAVFVVSQALCSVMPHVAGLLVARFLVGAGASVFSAVVGGVIADLWDKQDRNTPMALFSGAVLAGTGAGPLVAAELMHDVRDQTLAWKWAFWHQVVMDAVLASTLNRWYEQLEARGVYGVWIADPAAMVVAASASPGDAVLEKRDGPRQGQLRRIRWVVEEDEQRPPVAKMMALSVQRPFHLLFTEPVVFCFSLWAAFSWGVLYLSFSVVPFLYGTDLDRSSRVYVAMMVAAAVATASPEARLYFSCLTALLLPAGLFGAFLCPRDMDGYAEAVGLGFATWGIYSVYLATFNYLADAYHVYASSALAAQSFCRNVLGGGFPLLTGAMFANLGLRGAGGLLGGIAMALTVIPWVLVFLGGRIRARSKFAIVSYRVWVHVPVVSANVCALSLQQ
ncbi:putative drug/proton antiporter YHK8 [Tolypocladium ophioglossoides CBS 100239]|uniref:Putative drug/proton antiporter YHK8 n=1 Tax=Tolypocladium ophioglossoides (strain CBS 100239) TaxID=1163406 RepID=A0A0L0NII2_TOLOC|nr:putative drug/proton antiporter YHK8 [Tolypocladium ophioglossoides CBS 100239]